MFLLFIFKYNQSIYHSPIRSIQPDVFFLTTAQCKSILIVKTLTRLNNKDPLLERLGTNLMVTTKIMTIVETIRLYRRSTLDRSSRY